MKVYPDKTGCLCANSHPGSYSGQDAYNDMLPVIRRDIECTTGLAKATPNLYRGGAASALKNRDYKDFTDIVQEEISDYISATRDPILQELWETYGAEAVSEWGAGMLELVQQESLLQPGLYEGELQKQTEDRNKLDIYTQICKSEKGRRLLRNLRENRENRCASYRSQPAEQQPGEPSASVQKLSQPCTQKASDLLDMWCSGERIELLQQALHSFQKVRRPAYDNVSKGNGGACMKTEKAERKYVLRRLTPIETLRLQGLPDWWVDGADGSDSAIYKMAGNGLAIPCACDVLGRIAEEIRNNG